LKDEHFNIHILKEHKIKLLGRARIT